MIKITKEKKGWYLSIRDSSSKAEQTLAITEDELWDLITALGEWQETQIDMKDGEAIEI